MQLYEAAARAGFANLRLPGRVSLGMVAATQLVGRFFMRILLQQKENGLYFKDVDAWDPDPTNAMDFLCSTSAIDFCVANKISGVQLVLKFEEQRYDIVLPVLIQQHELRQSA